MKKPAKPARGTPAKASGGGAPTAGTSPTAPSRRALLRTVRNGALAAAVLATGGWVVVHRVQRHNELHDLTVIGNGVPTVVQIHDPQCPTCNQLKAEMLRAARDFAADELQVRIADIRTAKGRALADHHGVPHVTLLLFDGAGQVRDVLQGLTNSRFLRVAFRDHVERWSRPPRQAVPTS
jgi:predicted secreted protein